MREDLFITGTDTGVGKTVLSALLVAALDAVYWKPIQTGAVEGTDRNTVMRLAELPKERTLPEVYCFDPPVSPHLAAERAGMAISLETIRRPDPPSGRSLIVEGAGGILVPINDCASMLDLARGLGMPVVVAARSALGTINHTRLTIEVLRHARVPIKGVVVIGPENTDNERAIERFAGVPVVGHIPPLASLTRAALLDVFAADFDRQSFR
jgi:dethiobiotin synthetase